MIYNKLWGKGGIWLGKISWVAKLWHPLLIVNSCWPKWQQDIQNISSSKVTVALYWQYLERCHPVFMVIVVKTNHNYGQESIVVTPVVTLWHCVWQSERWRTMSVSLTSTTAGAVTRRTDSILGKTLGNMTSLNIHRWVLNIHCTKKDICVSGVNVHVLKCHVHTHSYSGMYVWMVCHSCLFPLFCCILFAFIQRTSFLWPTCNVF